jgi:pyruvate/2-oxoglutarate dehydrogenase complex dihydrolipoamide dehydrogenase (E3) component
MSALPQHAVVLGTGAGSLTVAAELELLGTKVTLADFTQFAGNINARTRRWHRNLTRRRQITAGASPRAFQ